MNKLVEKSPSGTKALSRIVEKMTEVMRKKKTFDEKDFIHKDWLMLDKILLVDWIEFIKFDRLQFLLEARTHSLDEWSRYELNIFLGPKVATNRCFKRPYSAFSLDRSGAVIIEW